MNLKEKILNNMPEGLTDLEKARYLYLELGKHLAFDEEYYLGNENACKRIYSQSKFGEIDWEIENGLRRGVCVDIGRMYALLLQECGIEAHVMQEEGEDSERPHAYTIVKIGDFFYNTDLQLDLPYIQTRQHTRYFGKKSRPSENISQEQLEIIDKKLGYIREDGYTDDKVANLKLKINGDMSIEDRLASLLDIAPNYVIVNDMGLFETDRYYHWGAKRFFTEKEREKIKTTHLYRKVDGEDKKKEYTTLISLQSKKKMGRAEYIRYIYSRAQGGYIFIPEEVLIRFLMEGLTPVGTSKIPEIKMPKARKESTKKVSRPRE